MKKSVVFASFLILFGVTVSAQLPYDTEMTKAMFSDAKTVYSKSNDCSWVNLFLTERIQLGSALNILSSATNYVVIALQEEGLSRKVYFDHAHGGSGTMSVETSTNHENWTGVWSLTEDGSIATGLAVVSDSAMLPSTTRFIRLKWEGTTTCSFGGIKVTELKDLSAGSDECHFQDALVGDLIQTKTVKINWTSIVASVSSTNPAFTVSASFIGQKNLENQTTDLAISYNHDAAGSHTGQIIIEGEGLRAVINVDGKTSKYNQQLTWTDVLGEHLTSDNITLHAFTDQKLPVSYISSDSTIAWVNEYGHVVCVCAGKVTLSAFQPGNYMFNGTDTVAKELILKRVDPLIAVAAADITYGQKAKECVLTETNGRVAGTLRWLETDPELVPDAGLYTWNVFFTPDDECMYNTAVRMVALRVNKAQQTIVWEQEATEVREGDILPLTATISSGLPVSFAMTNCIADIDESVLTGNEEGQTTVIAFHSGNNNYEPTVVVMHDITVLPAVQPVPTRMVSAKEVLKNGTKHIHEGILYLNYKGRTYDAQGHLLH